MTTILAYNDTFRMLGVISLVLIPFMFFLKSAKGNPRRQHRTRRN